MAKRGTVWLPTLSTPPEVVQAQVAAPLRPNSGTDDPDDAAWTMRVIVDDADDLDRLELR